jgi:hypothetical protein
MPAEVIERQDQRSQYECEELARKVYCRDLSILRRQHIIADQEVRC